MAKSDKLYGESPKLERDDESGKVEVKKPAKAEAEAEGQETEGMPAPARHAMDRMSMFMKHENEHAMSDYGKGGSKAEMMARHTEEMKAMVKRHEKEGGKK